MDEELQAGTRGLEYAHKKGLAVVVMEPIRGGRLVRPPETVAKLWANAPVQRTPQEWALRWVWNHPEVTLVLSGMSKMEQVVENVASAEHSEPHNLTAEELALIGQVRDAYRSSGSGLLYWLQVLHALSQRRGYTSRIFDLYNEAMIYNSPEKPRKYYSDTRDDQRRTTC